MNLFFNIIELLVKSSRRYIGNEFLELDDLSECDDLEFRDKIDIIEFPEYPVNACVLQKCNYTLDELIDDLNYDISEDEWISILFQIIFNLLTSSYANKSCSSNKSFL